MTRALLCSGQGRIERTMFDGLVAYAAAQPVLNISTVLLGRPPRQFLAEADDETISGNRASQILCTAHALAVAAVLHPTVPTMVAGYSVGEMAAWSLAGIWSAEQALWLTARRAELMDAIDGGRGCLGYIRGLGRRTVEELVVLHACALAIRNPGDLCIIGGLSSDVMACCKAALTSGARSAGPIPVHVASHTPRLEAAIGPFEDVLANETMDEPDAMTTLIGASHASVIRTPDQEAIDGLARQIATPIDWAAVLIALVERGARRMLELGPGDALATMVRATWPQVDARSVQDFQTIDGARRWFEAA